MDEMDRAQKEEGELNEFLVRAAVGHTELEVQGTGYCLYCGEPLPDGRRWCDKECCSSWEHENKRRNYGK